MELKNLTVKQRSASGKGGARQSRRGGDVPAILYGGEGETLRLSVNAKTFNHLLHGTKGEHALVQLEVEGNAGLSGPAMVKDVQHHPIRGQVIHADFMRIRLDEKIKTLTPVTLVGRSRGVVDGGLLDHQLREIEIECFALDVPEMIEANVTDLGIGDSLHVSNLVAPEGVTFVTPADRAVVAVHAPRVATTTEPGAAEGEVAAEGAADAAKAPADADKDKGKEKEKGKEKDKK